MCQPEESELSQADDMFQQHLPTNPHRSDKTEVLYTTLPKEIFTTKHARDFHSMVREKVIATGIEVIG